jgi:hypothetical protein
MRKRLDRPFFLFIFKAEGDDGNKNLKKGNIP